MHDMIAASGEEVKTLEGRLDIGVDISFLESVY